MRLAIVIASYNTREALQRCLDCIGGLVVDLSVRTIVIDNASSDGSADFVARCYPDVQLVRNTANLGFARASNQGVAMARDADFVLLLNSDAFLSSESLQELVAFAVNMPDAAVTGPQLLFEDGTWQRSHGWTPSPLVVVLDALGVTSLIHLFSSVTWRVAAGAFRPRQVDYVDGACMLIRRASIDSLGLLDERSFFYMEDVEYCVRARRNGWRVYYVPCSRVVHLRGHSLASRDPVRAAELRKGALRLFLVEEYGQRAQVWCFRWIRWNYQLRYWVSRILSVFGFVSSRRTRVYRENAAVYSCR